MVVVTGEDGAKNMLVFAPVLQVSPPTRELDVRCYVWC